LADASRQLKITRPEPSSFRDWDGRVFATDGRVLRALSAQGLANWEAFASSALYRRLTEDEELVQTRMADEEEAERIREVDPAGRWSAVLSHERIPFVSYPYEWTFSMLQDAALLQLRLTSEALREGLMLKDASPYNVQWRGARPIFMDVGSFERLRPDEPWPGYRQFCMLFLFPLLLEAYRGVPFQPWLRGRLDGIPPEEFRALFTRRDALRRGMLKHVFLHASLEKRNAARGAEVRDDLSTAGFDARLIQANLEQLVGLVRRLRSRMSPSSWEGYRATCSYAARDSAQKDDFVRRVVGKRRRSVTWDLGSNDGRFSRIAALGSDVTVAFDADARAVDALYRSLRQDRDKTILSLVVDLSNPSPALGWRNAERRTLADRGPPDLTLCLALVHHLSITNNIPLREIVEWLRSLDGEIVIEFPDRDDPMVTTLLQSKGDDAHPDYSRDTFEALLTASFDVVESLRLAAQERTLYHVRPR
jgi:hypothetical protein